jgi:RHS repeat-associated protein
MFMVPLYGQEEAPPAEESPEASPPEVPQAIPGTDDPPYVELQPPTRVSTATLLTLSIEWCDDYSLNHTSRQIKHNGVDVTSQFTYTTPSFSDPCPSWTIVRRSEKTLTLSTGTNTISAKICDTQSQCTTEIGTYTVTTQVAPTVALNNYSADHLDRSLCLTSGAGEAAAWQCGDLLVSHAMPGYATKGRDRSLTLLYNSATAAPRAVVAAQVTTPLAGIKPDTIYAELREGTLVKASAKFQSWNTTETRQIALAFPVSGYATGVYNFTLRVENRYNGSPSKETSVPVQLLIVNRTGSEFGGGWWPAGVEQLVLNQGSSILWVGGDGSAKLYQREGGPNTWRAPAGAFRDTLELVGGIYTRKLKHGVKVRFDAAGRHIQTINRTGDTTYVNWTGTPALLTSIKVPPSSATGITYTLAYASGKLDKITDPAGRILDATVTSSKLVTLKDPDNKTVTFTYETAPTSPYRMWKRTGRRGYTTRYEYTGDLRLTGAHVPITASPVDTARTIFRPWDTKGLVMAGATGLKQAARIDTVYTKIEGPRVGVADNAIFWVDRWGAPTKIQDPLNRVTTITRGDTLINPALPTSILFPDNRSATLVWDGRANLLKEILTAPGSTTDTTRYAYNDANTKDSPSSVTDPTLVVTSFTYNGMGLTEWITSPSGHKTRYESHPATAAAHLRGLLKSVMDSAVSVYNPATKAQTIQHPKTRFGYDNWGNLIADTSHMNHVRTYTRDPTYRRVTDAYDPENHRTHYNYDLLNRVKETIRYVEGGAQLKTVTKYPQDMVDSVADPRGVLRRFTYDLAGRQTVEIDELGKQATRGYDAGGLLLWEKPRTMQGTSKTISYTYDAAGRLLTKTWPAVTDTMLVPQGPFAGQSVPVTIPGDAVTYTYDSGDRMLTATTANYKVTRLYYTNGLLKQEIQSRQDGMTDKFTHYYVYDKAGRRTQYRLGSGTSGTTVLVDTINYKYVPGVGDLQNIQVRWRGTTRRDTVHFVWDGPGRRKQLTYSRSSGVSAPILVKFAYDGDGALRRICSTHGGSPSVTFDVFDMRIGMDTMDKDGLLDVINTGAVGAGVDPECTGYTNPAITPQTRSTFDMRHQMTRQVGADSLDYAYDNSGNMLKKFAHVPGSSQSATDSLQFTMLTGSNRIQTIRTYGFDATIRYDADGARTRIKNLATADVLSWRAYWYDALGRFSGEAHHECDPYGYYVPGTACQNNSVTLINNPNACRYEALGRLIWNCGDPTAAGVTFGYDGENVVRTAPDPADGRWSFVHGPGTDDPLIGHYYNKASGDHEYLWYVTDGQGRQYALGDSLGVRTDTVSGGIFYQAKYAGGISNAHSFGAKRNENTNLPGLSFFRNRFYDQNTGRWLQEDPLGLAAGTNLYQYVGNNPASFTDPFGLMPCDPPGSCQATGALIGGLVGGLAGGIVAGGCSAVSGGICALGAPAIVTGAAGLGTGLGGLSGAILAGGSGAIGDLGAAITGAVAGLASHFLSSDDRTADEIISGDKKGSIRRQFPGELLGKTLGEINELAKEGDSAARRARKLLKDNRFNKDN